MPSSLPLTMMRQAMPLPAGKVRWSDRSWCVDGVALEEQMRDAGSAHAGPFPTIALCGFRVYTRKGKGSAHDRRRC